METQMAWDTPEFEEIILNCEVSAYTSGDYETDSQPELN